MSEEVFEVKATTTRLTGVRALIARRMHQSLADSAQLTFNARFNAKPLLDHVADHRKGSGRLSLQDLIAYRFVQLLRAHPQFNATLSEGRIEQHREVHLGFAVETPSHLIVPVIRNAELLTPPAMASARRSLASKALAGTLMPSEMQGGSTTLSNLGSGRTESFTPILNPSQVTLLGIGGLRKTPWVSPDGNISACPIIGLSMTVDHRIVDGAPANRFLTELCEMLEAGAATT